MVNARSKSPMRKRSSPAKGRRASPAKRRAGSPVERRSSPRLRSATHRYYLCTLKMKGGDLTSFLIEGPLALVGTAIGMADVAASRAVNAAGLLAQQGTIITAALATKGVSAVGRSIEGVRHALFASDTVKDESGN